MYKLNPHSDLKSQSKVPQLNYPFYTLNNKAPLPKSDILSTYSKICSESKFRIEFKN